MSRADKIPYLTLSKIEGKNNLLKIIEIFDKIILIFLLVILLIHIDKFGAKP